MKFLLFILVIIDNLSVFLANNDNCGVNDLNALMARLLQLRTEFNNYKIQHDEQVAVLKEEINNKSLEIKLINEENRKQETELKELRQDVNNKTSEIAAISKDIEMIKDIDDCSPNQCQNGAMCVDGVTSYTCSCVAGYNGTLCEIDIDECTPDQCQNGATCTDGVDSYTCTCVAGYTGTNCETEYCPANWYFFQGSCYYKSTKSLKWLEAKNDCIDLGGHLVEITSEQENNFIQSILSAGSKFWIGLNDRVTEGVFVWVSSGNTMSGMDTKWSTREPNDKDQNEDCVEIIYTTGDWNDRDCSEACHYICEKLPD